VSRLVVLTGTGREHRYVANRLCGSLSISGVVVDEAVHQANLRRAFRGGLVRGCTRIGHYAFRRAIRDESRREEALASILSEGSERFEEVGLVTKVQGINSPGAVEVIERLEPDGLLVFGTRIVGPEVLRLARGLAFNLHTGISPQYRGTDCAFWPIVNEEPEWLGATVHECTMAVDGGQIFGVAQARWEPDDGLHEVFARAVVTGAELYGDVVARYAAGENLAGQAQDLSTGREYRGYMRTLGPELKARLAIRRGLLKRSAPGPS
jgi:methionyl-tRNA formyltransferase